MTEGEEAKAGLCVWEVVERDGVNEGGVAKPGLQMSKG